MSDNNDNSNRPPKPIEKFSEEEQKEIIEKLKAQLNLENDEDSVRLYASLLKSLL